MDILLRLYDLPPGDGARGWTDPAVSIRRALVPERAAVLGWVAEHFRTPAWLDETRVAFTRLPVSCSIAVVDGALAGFLCTEVTARGFLGPGGVAARFRRRGIFTALLLHGAHVLHEAGYAYAVVGDAADATLACVRRFTEPIVIPGSSPGLYRGMLSGGSEGA